MRYLTHRQTIDFVASNALHNNPDALEALLKAYQIPFKTVEEEITKEDAKKGERPFLECQYNQVGDQHRSPWTRELYPKRETEKEEDPQHHDPEEEQFQAFELTTNEVWHAYKNLYYGHEAIGSVFLERGTGKAFQGIFGVFKEHESVGCWHSVNLVSVEEPGEETCTYQVETFAISVVETRGDEENEKTRSKMSISAAVKRELTKELKLNASSLLASHIENIGELIETNEIDLRTQLERIQMPKTIEIVDKLVKDKEKSFRPPGGVNPLMGMIMDSDVLKRKLAKS